ncbi:MAG: hypothetical protein KTR18_05415 [Acidiferrobacterales bacterium]|nr:hypothetical protein [Acidiferrobacterales bacterium]
MKKEQLEKKLAALIQRKEELEQRLGTTRATENASTRKSDTKYRVNSGRAVQARAKKGEKAMLQMVNQMIQRTRSQLNQQ